ncbi:MAG: acylphosphatase [Xanthobacteraceae bacterium]|jgi:acylphosphatase
MSEPCVRRVMIRGRVQGVGFRAFVEHAALKRGIQGWVRNRRDGSVEAVFAGPTETVAAVIEVCRRGPGGSQVEMIDEFPAGPDDVGSRYPGELFSVLPTA